jgi:hypothetical protein
MLDLNTAKISTVLSLDEHLSQILSVPKAVTSHCLVLFSTSLLGYILLNVSQTAAETNSFDAK